MARPQKIELDYFPLVCGFFQDERIIALRREHGALGIATYIFLLTKVYGHGYYIKIRSLESFAQTIAENIASSREPTAKVATHVIKAIRYMAEIDLISKQHLKVNCITGVKIQEQYAKSKERYGGRALIKEFSLIDGNNAFELVLEDKTAVNATETAVSVTETPNKATEMQQSKVKESKVNTVVAGLTETEYKELCDKLGKEDCDYYIERVKAFRQKQPQASFSVKSTMLKWYREDKAKSTPQNLKSGMRADEINAAFAKLNEEL